MTSVNMFEVLQSGASQLPRNFPRAGGLSFV